MLAISTSRAASALPSIARSLRKLNKRGASRATIVTHASSADPVRRFYRYQIQAPHERKPFFFFFFFLPRKPFSFSSHDAVTLSSCRSLPLSMQLDASASCPRQISSRGIEQSTDVLVSLFFFSTLVVPRYKYVVVCVVVSSTHFDH